MAGQVWVTNSVGGHLTNNSLSKSLRMQNDSAWVFRQFADIKEDPGKRKGDTVFFDKVLRLDTKGGTLVETATVPEARFKVVKDSVVLTELGNSVPWTDKLETLAEFDPSDIAAKMLKSDQLEVIDSLVSAQFDTAAYTAVATNTATTIFTSNGTATITATANASDKTVRDIVDKLETIWVPKFSDGNYRAVVSVNTRRGIYDFLQAVAQYAEPSYRHNSEVGQYYSCRFVVDQYGGVLSNAVGNSSLYGEGFFFGQEAVLEAVALLEEVRRDPPADLGRSKKVGWYGIMNWKRMWYSVNDDLNTVGKGIDRIIRLTSA